MTAPTRVRVVTPELLDSAVASLVSTAGTAAHGAVASVGSGGGTVQATGVSAATPSTLVQRDAAGRTQFVDPAVAADAATKHYVDTTVAGYVQSSKLGTASGVATLDGNSLVTAAQLPTWIARQFGSGTAFPGSGSRQGDSFFRTDLGTNGSLWTFTGNTNIGYNGWICDQPILCTSTTRPTTSLYGGMSIYETDTKANAQFDGAAWFYNIKTTSTKIWTAEIAFGLTTGMSFASQSIPFPAGFFTAAPNVLISMGDTANDYHWIMNASGISTTGCTVNIAFASTSGGAPTNGNVNAYLLAMGR